MLALLCSTMHAYVTTFKRSRMRKNWVSVYKLNVQILRQKRLQKRELQLKEFTR